MKKLIASLLSVMMVMCFMPSMAWAADGGSALPAPNDKGVIVLDKDYEVTTLDTKANIDLNGFNLTVNGTSIMPGTGETLTITSSKSVEPRGTLTFGAKADYTKADFNPQAGGTVTVNNINIVSPNSVFYPQGDAAAVNVTNCDVKAGCYCVGTNASSTGNAGVVITLKNSTLTTSGGNGDNCTVMINVEGKLNIDNCIITGDRQTVLVRAGESKIENSTIVNNGLYHNLDQYNTGNWGSGNEVPAAAVVVGSHNGSYTGDAKVQLTNSKVTGTNCPALYVDANTTYSSDIQIDGEKTEVTGTIKKTDNGNGKIGIVAGTFTDEENAKKYIPSGTLTEEVDGKVIVGSASSKAVAEIDGVGYATLGDAIKSIKDNKDTIITLLKDVNNAEGIAVDENKSITIDFAGHEYILTGPGEGSSGTETNGFQLLKNSTITFKNGTIKIAENPVLIKRIIQNYADLTLENMQIYAANQIGGEDYALSFNNGDITFKGNTSVITTSPDTVAFDVYYWQDSYPEGTKVTFDESYTGTVNGKIVYDSVDKDKAELTINGKGNFGSIEKSATTGGQNISISGGTFDKDVPEDFLAEGKDTYKRVNGKFTVAQETTSGQKPALDPTPGSQWVQDADGNYVEKPIYVPTVPTTQKPIIESADNATVTLSTDGTQATIKVADGYELVDVTVNGVSKGKVDTLTGLKTGDKIVVKTQKKADDNAALIEAVKNTKLVARTAMSKAKGKKAVKVYWYAKDGSELNFDGYEVYRSLKRYEGFGTKPFFKTAKEKYYNTAIKKGTKYYYKVRAYKVINGEKVYTDWSTKAWRTVK